MCPTCQHLTHANVSAEVSAAVQYDPRLAGMSVSVMAQQLLLRRRTTEILCDLLGVQIREGTLATHLKRAAEQRKPVETQIKTALSQEKIIHQNNTGLYVMGSRWWSHVTSTRHLTH